MTHKSSSWSEMLSLNFGLGTFSRVWLSCFRLKNMGTRRVSVWDGLYVVSRFLRNCPGKALSAPDPYRHYVRYYGSCIVLCHDLTGWEYRCFQCITKPLANCQQVDLQTLYLVVS